MQIILFNKPIEKYIEQKSTCKEKNCYLIQTAWICLKMTTIPIGVSRYMANMYIVPYLNCSCFRAMLCQNCNA